MLSKIKQLLDSNTEEQLDDHDQQEQGTNMFEREVQQLHSENEELRAQLSLLQGQQQLGRMHIEFFYYHPHGSAQFSAHELDHLPVMSVTVHFMEADKPIPPWMLIMLTGLENTLRAMKVHYRNVNEPHLYSIFVDTKLYPQQEVKKVMHVLVKQLECLRRENEKKVTTRVHVGDDELYEDLLHAYEKHA